MRFIATVSIHKEDEWYIAKCLENNVASHGKSIEEALAYLKEALELYFEDEEIPTAEPRFFTSLEIAV
ncbi:MAG: type II toxin-antitoxin system HicB family antitoxin [Defluviitaleaceae bacterium]|nr:type II toxin-antitoxin system HicB family antitoxin [Defluviitaleaceae bacterium]